MNSEQGNWVKARAYGDGQFLLEKLYSRIASDVFEANRLPDSVTPQAAFSCEYNPENIVPDPGLDPERASVVTVNRDNGESVRTLILWAKHDRVIVDGPNQPILEVIAKGHTPTGSAKWAIIRRDGVDQTPVEWLDPWEISEALLSRFLFG